jgi:hypothetical protein
VEILINLNLYKHLLLVIASKESVPAFLCGVAKSRREMKSQSSSSTANSVFSRLCDATIVSRKLKEERVRVFSAVLIESEQCELQSQYAKDQLLKPFQPDISPISRSLKIEGCLFSHLDALGEREQRFPKSTKPGGIAHTLLNAHFIPT